MIDRLTGAIPVPEARSDLLAGCEQKLLTRRRIVELAWTWELIDVPHRLNGQLSGRSFIDLERRVGPAVRRGWNSAPGK